MNKFFLAALVLALSSFSLSNYNDIKTVRLDKSKSSITYHLSHPLHEWDGISNDIDGVVQFDDKSSVITKVALTTKISSFDSKNSNRDSHLLEVTEALKYPSVTFVSTAIKDNGSSLEVTGKITFHNVTKDINFTAASISKDKTRQVSGNFVLLLEDFKIDRPSLMMMKTDNEMKMKFSVEYTVTK
jgi:polyisoprenoid-binding protein YceI